MSTETAGPKRFEWIDNARIIAALLIIYAHMSQFFPNSPLATSQYAINIVTGSTLYGRVPYFLILAGYFLGRRITWGKALDRALWLFIPFFIWNLGVFALSHTNGFSWSELPGMLGIGCLGSHYIHICGLPESVPAIAVTWFLRDIVVLSLLTPLLVRYRWLVLSGIAIAISYNSFNFVPYPKIMLAPHTCFYYVLGVCLCNFKIEDAYSLFSKKFAPVYAVGLLFAIGYSIYDAHRGGYGPPVTLAGGVFGAMMIAYGGVLIERYLPRLSKRLAPCGPACFLVFVLHYHLFFWVAPYVPTWITGSVLIWLLPIVMCAFIIAVFLLMKRYAPWLMPYLGHMKVPKKQAN